MKWVVTKNKLNQNQRQKSQGGPTRGLQYREIAEMKTMMDRGHPEIVAAHGECVDPVGKADLGHLHEEANTIGPERPARNMMIEIAAIPGRGSPDRVRLPGLDIKIGVMLMTVETDGIAPISGVIGILQGPEAVKHLRREKSKEKELSNISRLTKEVEMITDSSFRKINKDIKLIQ